MRSCVPSWLRGHLSVDPYHGLWEKWSRENRYVVRKLGTENWFGEKLCKVPKTFAVDKNSDVLVNFLHDSPTVSRVCVWYLHTNITSKRNWANSLSSSEENRERARSHSMTAGKNIPKYLFDALLLSSQLLKNLVYLKAWYIGRPRNILYGIPSESPERRENYRRYKQYRSPSTWPILPGGYRGCNTCYNATKHMDGYPTGHYSDH